ncbi:MAG: PepSY domain-containing protein [Oceanicaulis sp.]
MTRFFALLFSAAALLGAAPAAQAAAVSDTAAFGAEWRADISARDARNIAERAYPRASVLDVRYVDGGRPYYAVRMIEDGRRFDVRVDAQSGRIF